MSRMTDQLTAHAMSATHEVAKALESAETDEEWLDAQKKVGHAKQIAGKLGRRAVSDLQSSDEMLSKAKQDIEKAMQRADKAKRDAAEAECLLISARIDEEAATKLHCKGSGDKAVSDMMSEAVVKAEIAFHEEAVMRQKRREQLEREHADEQARAEMLRQQQREKAANELLKRQEAGKSVSSAFKNAGQYMCGCE